MSTAEIALIVSAASLLVSVLALGWHIFNATRVDRPRLRLSVTCPVMPDGRGNAWEVVSVEAVNTGKRGVRVSGLHLAWGPQWRWWRRMMPRRWRAISGGSLLIPNYTHPVGSVSTPMPVYLDPWDSAHTLYTRDLVDQRMAEDSRSGERVFANASTSLGTRVSRKQPLRERRPDLVERGKAVGDNP